MIVPTVRLGRDVTIEHPTLVNLYCAIVAGVPARPIGDARASGPNR